MLQKYSLRRTRFEGGTSIPFCSRFQVEEGELEFHSPSVNHSSLREGAVTPLVDEFSRREQD